MSVDSAEFAPTTARRFTGRVALVTGASRGIGRGIAERLVAEGARVCLTARRAEALGSVVDELGGAEHAVAVAGSADDPDHQRAAVHRAVERFGRLDVLVANAGINPVYGPLLEADLGAARKILEVNLLGTLGWVRAAHAAGLAKTGGSIVLVTSVAGLRAAEGIGFYGATKAALLQMTQQLAVELGPDIRVNAVAPAVVRTRFATALFEGREDEVVARYPLARLGVPADIAAAVAYLASDDASWTTGQTLVVDGGLTTGGGI